MMRMYEDANPRTSRELDERRYHRARREEQTIRHRKRVLRLILCIVAICVVGIHIIDPNMIIAAGAIWTCFDL